MKKIIGGRRYDTDTAKALASYEIGMPSDLDYIRETLYRTKAGVYFLHGEGGPRSKYSEYNEIDQWACGSKILPIAEEDAREWAEGHMDADTYDMVFGVTSDDMVPVTVVMPKQLLDKLDAVKGRASRSDVILQALLTHLKSM